MKDFITTPQKKIVSKFSTILDEKFWGKADYFTDTINDFPVKILSIIIFLTTLLNLTPIF